MAVVLKADTSTTNIPKVIETKNGMIFHGQYYNKENLSPVAFQYFITDSLKTMINTNKRVRPAALTNRSEVWNEDTIIADEYEPNIFYGIIYNGSGFYVLKYKEVQNKIEVITKGTFINYPYDKYLGQNKNYLYFSILGNSIASTIYRIDKQTLVLTVTYTGFGSSYSSPIKICIKIFENDSYIYFGYCYNAYSLYFNIIRLIKDKNSTEDIKTYIPIFSEKYFKNFIDNKDVFEISDNVIGFYLVSLMDKTNPLKLIKLNFNETIVADMVTVEDINFTWDEKKEGLSPFPDGFWYAYETFITKSGDKKFVNIIMYQNADQYVTAQIANQGLYTFEITDFNNLKFINYNTISDSVLKGYLLSKDRSFLVISTANSTIFMKFDAEDGCYKITNTLEIIPICIGLDLMERVWIMKQDNEVDVYSLSDATDYNVKFKKDYYDYTGENIETFITIEAKNFIGEYININIELSIDGNAKFKENDSKTIQLVTSTDGSLNVPVIITGANQITIYSKLLR